MSKNWKRELLLLGNEINNCTRCTKAKISADKKPIGKNVINCKKDDGVPPRCFYPQNFTFSSKVVDDEIKGIIVVGLNPGKAGDDEKNWNRTNKGYKHEKCGWENKWSEHDHEERFYRVINHFLESLNKSVDKFSFQKVLWTEVFKCELDQELPKKFSTEFKYFENYWRRKIISMLFALNDEEDLDRFLDYYKTKGIKNIQNENYYSIQEENLNEWIKPHYDKWKEKQKKADSVHHYLKNVFVKEFKKLEWLSSITFNGKYGIVDLKTDLDLLVFNYLDGDETIVERDKLTDTTNKQLNFKRYFKALDYNYSYKNEIITLQKNEIKLTSCSEKDIILAMMSCPLLLKTNGKHVALSNVRNYEDVASYCYEQFLAKELENVDPDWPVLCIGKESFKYLRYASPNRIVIGLPHVTGSFGGQANIYLSKNNDWPERRKKIFEFLNNYYNSKNLNKEIKSAYFK